jgi:ADP-dependent phosphofructokinase/glucokinase
MHHGRGRRFRRPGVGQRFYEPERVLERLEEYQRDLEQELADVADLIGRLKQGKTEQV